MSFVSKHNKFHKDGVAFWSIRYSNMQYSKMGGSPIVGHYRVEVHKYKCIIWVFTSRITGSKFTPKQQYFHKIVHLHVKIQI